MDKVLLCLFAIKLAIEENSDQYFSFVNDYGVLRMLAMSFEHAYYVNIHTAKPHHTVNFFIFFQVLDDSGTPQLWQMLDRDIS